MEGKKRIEVLEDDATSSSSDEDDNDMDDMPPPLEDMSKSIKFKQKYTKVVKKKEKSPVTATDIPPTRNIVGTYTKGTTVSLFGLSTQKYNGCEGVVLGYDVAAERHMVKLKASGKSLKLKPANLKIVETYSGFGKGFLNDTDEIKLDKRDDDDGIEFIKAKNPEEKPGQLPEVQEMLNAQSMMKEREKEWCNEDLLNKISKKPDLMKMMSNPKFAHALTEFEKNPKEALRKYGNNPEIAAFFKSFCGIMGTHLTNLEDTKKSKTTQSNTPSATSQVAVQSPDDKKLQDLLARPEVVNALQDKRIMAIIQTLKEKPHLAGPLTDKAMREPDLAQKLNLLISVGLLDLRR